MRFSETALVNIIPHGIRKGEKNKESSLNDEPLIELLIISHRLNARLR